MMASLRKCANSGNATFQLRGQCDCYIVLDVRTRGSKCNVLTLVCRGFVLRSLQLEAVKLLGRPG